MGISYALWGAVFGWLLMPGLRGPRALRGTRMAAYFAALTLAISFNHFFHFHRQVYLFLLGMAAQFGFAFVVRLLGRQRLR